MKIKITSLHLEGYTLPVPGGLNDLLSKIEYWGPREENVNPNYEREVKKVNNRPITILTKKTLEEAN